MNKCYILLDVIAFKSMTFAHLGGTCGNLDGEQNMPKQADAQL